MIASVLQEAAQWLVRVTSVGKEAVLCLRERISQKGKAFLDRTTAVMVVAQAV